MEIYRKTSSRITPKPILRQDRNKFPYLPRLSQSNRTAKRKPFKGFEKQLDAKQLERLRRKLTIATLYWRPQKILRAMAMINGLVWAIAKNAGAVEYDEGKKLVNRSAIARLVHRGGGALKTSIKGLFAYASQHWQEARQVSETSIRVLRDELAQMGLFKVTSAQWGKRFWTGLIDINFTGLLVLQEVLEHAWLKIHNRTLDELPSHKAGFVRLCWNAAKHVFGREFNRVYGAKIKVPSETETVSYASFNRGQSSAAINGTPKPQFFPEYLEAGVVLDADRRDREGNYYPPDWLDDFSEISEELEQWNTQPSY